MVLALNLYVACCCLLCSSSFQRKCLLVVFWPSWWSGCKGGKESQLLCSVSLQGTLSQLQQLLSLCEHEQGVDLFVLNFISVHSGLSSDGETREGEREKQQVLFLLWESLVASKYFSCVQILSRIQSLCVFTHHEVSKLPMVASKPKVILW